MKEKNPKILIVLDNSLDFDIRVKNEINILKDANFIVTVICFHFDQEKVSSYADIEVIRIPVKRKKKNKLFLLASWTPFYSRFWSNHIVRELKRKKYDLVYSHDLYMIGAVRLALIRLKRSIPFIIDLHEHYAAAAETYSWTKGFPRRQLSRPWDWYRKEKTDLKYPDLCITLSDAFSKRLSELTQRKIDDFFAFPNITPNPPLYKLKINLPFNHHNVLFLYYGAIAERRGIFDLLEAFLTLADTSPNSKLLLIGPVDKADKPRFNSYLNNPKLKKNTHYIPWIESKYWINYAQISDFCLAPFHVNPQHNSGVANKIYQYLQAGKFIIASNCIPQKNLINKFKAGTIFESNEELVQTIINCTNNIDLYKEKGQKAATLFREQNIFEKNAKSFVKKVSELINK